MLYDGLSHGVRKTLAYLKQRPPDYRYHFGEDSFTAAHLIGTLEHFLDLIEKESDLDTLNRIIRQQYWVYRSIGGPTTGQVLYTGYFEPILDGRSTPQGPYRHPVYGRPKDLAVIDLSMFSSKYKGERIIGRYTDPVFVPYHDRDVIEEKGLLDDKSPVLAWVRDPIDLFFLQIQGSGQIVLENGQTLHVHYHISNGRPYRSIGRLLIDQGKIEKSQMSMQALKAYLRAHPEEMNTIFNHNPSYVFFKREKDGPLGALEVKLTPGRSLAVDRRTYPLPALAYIATQMPVIDGSGEIQAWVDCRRFVLNQDTGGAIKGPGRADLFFGNGAYAEVAAGHLQAQGDYFLLVLAPEGS